MYLKKLENNHFIVFSAIFFITISLFITYKNIGLDKDFIGEDSGVMYLFPDRILNYSRFMWDSYWAPGKSSISNLFAFSWNNMQVFLHNLGLNYFIIQRIYYVMFFFISGFGMFILSIHVISLHYKNVSRALLFGAAITSGSLYMLNHMTMYLGGFPIISFHIFYQILPWLFFIISDILHRGLSYKKTVFLFVCMHLLIGSNPAHSINVILLLFGFCLYYKKLSISLIKKHTGQILLFSVAFILLQSYLIFPILTVGAGLYGDIGGMKELVTSLEYNSRNTSFLKLFVFGGGLHYAPLYHHNGILLFIGYSITIFGLVALIFQKGLKIKGFLGLVFIVSLFLAKGMHQPLQQLFTILFTEIPYFTMYRAAYNKFIFLAIFSLSLLIGMSVVDLVEKNKNLKKMGQIFFLLPMILIFLYMHPFFSGKIVSQNFLTKIPNEYLTASTLIRSDDDHKIVSFPPSPNGGGPLLQWGDNRYVGPNVDSFFFNKPVLDSYWFIQKGYFKLNQNDSWTGTRLEKKLSNLMPIFDTLNVRYILVHKDYVHNHEFGDLVKRLGTRLKIQELNNQLDKIPSIEIIEDNDYFTLYDTHRNAPHIFIPDTVIKSKNQMKSHETLLNLNKANTNFAVVSDFIKIASNNKNGTIEYKKINPTHYNVTIKNTHSTIPLIFSESFDKNWIIKTTLGDKRINNHFLANNYANGWVIDTNTLCNENNYCKINADNTYNIDLTITFRPQSIFNIGLLVGSVAVGMYFIFITIHFIIKKQ